MNYFWNTLNILSSEAESLRIVKYWEGLIAVNYADNNQERSCNQYSFSVRDADHELQ